MNQFFDIITVLTTHRTEECKQELEWHNIKASFYQSIFCDDPLMSYNLSILQILEKFLETDKETILILEDDVTFKSLDRMPQIMEEAKSYDILYLGGNYVPYLEHKPAEPYTHNLRKINSAWGTHAISFKRNIAEWIIENYTLGRIFDNWLDEQLDKFNALAVVPMLARQKAGKSGLWDREVDYKEIYDNSDKYLLSI